MTASDQDERYATEYAVADQLAEVSEARVTPNEFGAVEPFSADDVDFASNGWMARLSEVQGWLRLPEILELEDPETFVCTLVRSLGYDADDSSGVDSPGRLSDHGLERLRERLEHARQLQQQFIEVYEAEGGSEDAATGWWTEAWDDEPDGGPGAGPVDARADTWQIHTFVYHARKGLDLRPSYQRGDVWPTADSQMLIESILRGIPLPSIIILERGDDAKARFEVVDGKQRLTAILRFMGRHPEARLRVAEEEANHPGSDLTRLLTEDYPAFRKAWKYCTGEQLTSSVERANLFPFKLRRGVQSLTGRLAPVQGRYYTEIRNVEIDTVDGVVPIQEIFEIDNVYSIPVIKYSGTSRRQIHEVFNLYNKQGKHLNAEEIRNALYHDLDLARALIVTAGDNDDVETVAPVLLPVWEDVEAISDLLDDYSFGSARYRRTKVLSWIAALLLSDAIDDGEKGMRSTAGHIDELLHRIESHKRDPLRSAATIQSAFRVLAQSIKAHSAVDAWAPIFKNRKQGTRWQELQLVASLLGVTLATVVLDDEVEDKLADAVSTLRHKSKTPRWERPQKTQTLEQWKYIARVSFDVLDALEVEPDEVSAALKERFGTTCIPTLKKANTLGGADTTPAEAEVAAPPS